MKSLGQIVASRPIHTVAPDATVLDAALLMAEQGVGAVLVLKRGKLAGIFTERDLLTRVVARSRDPAVTPVCEVMTAEVVVGQADEPYLAGLEKMHQAACRHLPVCRGERLVGMVSLSDLLLTGVEAIKARLEEARL